MSIRRKSKIFDVNYIIACPSNLRRIILFSLKKDHGYVVLDNGYQLDIFAGRLQMLKDYQCDKSVRIYSDGAGLEWADPNFWEKALLDIKKIYIHGPWNEDLAAFILKCCKNICLFSATYWICSSFQKIVEAITSDLVEQITVHLNGTETGAIELFEILGIQSKEIGFRLKNLMVFFKQNFKVFTGEFLYNRFGNIFVPNDFHVDLFFSEEGDFCMNELLSYNYDNVGHIYTAINFPEYTDETEQKLYERYECYEKSFGGGIINVGVKTGKRESYRNIYPLDRPSYTSQGVLLDEYDVNSETETHSKAREMSDEEFQRLRKCPGDYPLLKIEEPISYNCCVHYRPKVPSGHRQFGCPAFKNTRIQVLIYHFDLAEFFLDNGIYFRLSDVNNEQEFLFKNRATRRFIVLSTSYDRKFVGHYNFDKLIQFVDNIEFMGYWFSTALKPLFQLIESPVTTLTLMRFAMDRRAFRALMDGAPDTLTTCIRNIFYDSRDSIELSAASVLNGLTKNTTFSSSFGNLNELFIIVRQLSDDKFFYNGIGGFMTRVMTNTTEGAIITAVICSGVTEENLYERDFMLQTYTLVPTIYSNRSERGCSKYLRSFYKYQNNRYWYIVIP